VDREYKDTTAAATGTFQFCVLLLHVLGSRKLGFRSLIHDTEHVRLLRCVAEVFGALACPEGALKPEEQVRDAVHVIKIGPKNKITM
jgi:hypothetical protein